MVAVEMFSVHQHVTGCSSSRNPASSGQKPSSGRKGLKGALMSVASKNWFTVSAAVPSQ